MQTVTPSTISRAVGWPFLVTLAGVGVSALLGACDTATACQVKSFVVAPIILVVILVTGLIAGRLSASSRIGLGAMIVASGVVIAITMATGAWYRPPDQEAKGPASDLLSWVLLTGVASALLLPGFAIGRSWRVRSEVKRLMAQHATGAISPDEFQHGLMLQGRASDPDQAPPHHRCGRCGKPLSPVWRSKCRHCGATYVEFPPVPSGEAPS